MLCSVAGTTTLDREWGYNLYKKALKMYNFRIKSGMYKRSIEGWLIQLSFLMKFILFPEDYKTGHKIHIVWIISPFQLK